MRICLWCQKVLGESPIPVDTHGICPECFDRVFMKGEKVMSQPLGIYEMRDFGCPLVDIASAAGDIGETLKIDVPISAFVDALQYNDCVNIRSFEVIYTEFDDTELKVAQISAHQATIMIHAWDKLNGVLDGSNR